MNMNLEKKMHSNSDRISDLPEPIRKHILLFLPTRDAVRSSILSSSWRALWIELPILDFGQFQLSKLLRVKILPSNDDDTSRMKRDSIAKKREEYYHFLDRTLGSISKLEKLSLYVPYTGVELNSRVDHWLDCVIVSHVKELELHINGNGVIRYSLPKSVLNDNSITKLNLNGCELNSSSLVDTQLPSLQKLSLQDVYIDEGVMESLATMFPNLEVLTFKHCHGLTRIEIFGLTKLVKVEIEHFAENCEAIEIDAPNLLEFTYVNEGDDLDRLYHPCDIEVAACVSMKRLKLVGVLFDNFDLSMLLERLPALEQLLLYHCNCLRDIYISSQNLVLLEFEHCRDLLTAELITPNLKFFHYAEDDPISFISKGPVLKLTEATIYLKPDIKVDKWYVGLVKFLSKLCNCERLTICVGFEEDLIVPEKVRAKSRPPLRGVKHLMVELRASFIKHTPVEFIEALLWLAPCPESISIYNDFIPICKLLKFTYEKPLKGKKKCGCWKSPLVFCWRHALEKVSLDNQEGDEDDTGLATFFSKARFDGKMVSFFKNTSPKKIARRY